MLHGIFGGEGFKPTFLGVRRGYPENAIIEEDLPLPSYIGVVVEPLDKRLEFGKTELIRIDDYKNRRLNQPGKYHNKPFFIVVSKDSAEYRTWEEFMANVMMDVTGIETSGLEGRLIDAVRTHLPDERNYLASDVGPGRWDKLCETLR